MAEYIGCRKCDSTDCKGCNLKNLETMLNNGKFDCLMNGNRCINTAADVVPVLHGRWIASHDDICTCSICKYPVYAAWNATNYCPNCGAKMDGGDGNSDMA